MKKRGVGLKGQVTAFIIVGIVILISVSAVIYLRGKITKEEGIELITAPRVSVEFAPINNFVKSCINRITDEGLELAENRGGYLYQEDLETGLLDTTEGNAVEFLPDSGVLVPYWHYMESPNPCTNCGFRNGIPPLCKGTGSCLYAGANSVEEQLERYIEENIKSCVDEFDTERLGYEIIELGEPNAMVTIGDKSVVVNLRYPLEIKKDEASTEINRFIATIQSEFTELYTMAYELTQYQMNNCFIGRHTQSFLSYFMGLGEGQLPPIAEQTMGEANPKIWFMYEVKEMLKPRISAAVSSIGIMNTKNFWYPYADPDDSYYKTMQGVLDQRVFIPFDNYHHAEVFIKYLPWWDIYADIRPREGQKIMPSDMGGPDAGGMTKIIGMLIQLKDYTFFYQYSFPVVIDIQKTDFKGEPHTFRFGIEVNVRANRCIGNDTSVGHVSNPLATQLCNSVHATESATVTVKETVDVKGYPAEVTVPDVIVKFFAGQSCLLGSTDENGVLELNYPSVHGGYFNFIKEGYGSVSVKNADITDPTTIQIHRFKEFNVDVEHYKIVVNRTTGERTLEGPTELIAGEKVIITIDKINEPSITPQVVAFEGGVESEFTLNLLPDGDYDITANYFNDKKFTLPPKCSHMCEGGIDTGDEWDFETNTPTSWCCGEECPTDGSECDCEIPGDILDLVKCCSDVSEWLPDDPMNVSTMGGARFNASQPWHLSKGVWNSGDTVLFKVISLPKADCMISDNCIVPGCIGYSDELGNLEKYYDDFWVDLLPEIK